MSTLPLISVIVPVYNVEDYLDACVKSITAQTYTNLQIILVDDGSTDRSGSICDKFASTDPRIRVIHKDNGGLSDARNHGIDIATGDYIVFVDSDDTITPDAITTLYSLASEHNAAIAMATFDTRRINSGSTLAMTGIEAAKRMLYQDSIDASACGKLFSIKLFQKARFTKGIFYEDLDFMMKVVPSISKAVWTDRPLYHYTMRPTSITGSFSLKRLDVLDVTDRIIANAVAYFPELLPAARDRSLSASFNMFVLLCRNGYARSPHADRCWRNIKAQRFGSLFNRNVRLKNKLGILASFPGRRFFSVILRIFNNS
ncbi:MAG: glycosyltransferase family 2 protein [Muribaculaceae bacterium]